MQQKHRHSCCFNPRTYIRYDKCRKTVIVLNGSFNPRTYIRYDDVFDMLNLADKSFNPRTYIRYDYFSIQGFSYSVEFQSTYLYKVRLMAYGDVPVRVEFQSTYLYKVRRYVNDALIPQAVSIHVPI